MVQIQVIVVGMPVKLESVPACNPATRTKCPPIQLKPDVVVVWWRIEVEDRRWQCQESRTVVALRVVSATTKQEEQTVVVI